MISVGAGLLVSSAISAGASLLGGIGASGGSSDEADLLAYEARRRQRLADLQMSLLRRDFDFEQAVAENELRYNIGLVREQGREVRGQQAVNFAAGGVDVSAGGSPFEAMRATTTNVERDARMLTYNRMVARVRSSNAVEMNAAAIRLGVRGEVANLTASADSARKSSRNALLAGFINAGTEALGGYTRWKDFQNKMGKA